MDFSVDRPICNCSRGFNGKLLLFLLDILAMLFVHKCLFNSQLLQSVFHGYFDLNSSVHLSSNRS